MRKRALVLFFASVLSIVCVLAFASCGDTTTPGSTEESSAPAPTDSGDTNAPGNADGDYHSHEYGEWYVITPSSCTVNGEREKKCSCGHAVREQIGFSHSFVDGYCTACNEKEASEGLAYRLVNNEYYVVTGIGTCADTEIYIASIHNGLPVKMIEAQAFEGNKAITGVTIPNSVTDIGYGAFKGCSALTRVCLSNNLAYLTASAFYDCPRLECTEYEGALYIGSSENPYLFLVKAKDTDIVTCEINENTRFIGDMAFYRCASLERLVIPMGIVDIGSHAFSRCDILQYNEYDNGCYLGNEENPYLVLASLKSTQITSCQINESTVFIGSTVFENCDKLESIVIPKSVRTICASAFWECGGLKSIIFEEGSLLTNIAPAAFCDCGNLESVILPSGVKRIAYGVFYDCKRLTSVFVPESVEYVEAWAFMLCPNLTICCEVSSQPNEWSPDWNGHNYTTEWSSSLEN